MRSTRSSGNDQNKISNANNRVTESYTPKGKKRKEEMEELEGQKERKRKKREGGEENERAASLFDILATRGRRTFSHRGHSLKTRRKHLDVERKGDERICAGKRERERSRQAEGTRGPWYLAGE